MQLTIHQLKRCIEIVLTWAENSGLDTLDTQDSDFYWTVLDDDWLNFHGEPTKLGVGSLDSDLEHLSSLLTDPSRTNICDLDRVAAAFRLMGVMRNNQIR